VLPLAQLTLGEDWETRSTLLSTFTQAFSFLHDFSERNRVWGHPCLAVLYLTSRESRTQIITDLGNPFSLDMEVYLFKHFKALFAK
jgi:hypothetical protein